jgi:hypothetical protein
MAPVTLIIAAAAVVCLQLVAINTLSAKLLPLSIAGGFFVLYLAQRQRSAKREITSQWGGNKKAAYILLAYLVLVVVWQLHQNVSTGIYLQSLEASLEQFVDTAVLFAVLCVVGFGFHFLNPTDKIGAVAVGIALFGLANLGASYLGYTDLTEFGESRLDASKIRWRAPLAMSTGTLGTMQTVAACCLIFLCIPRKDANGGSFMGQQRLLFVAACLPAVATTVLCEFRYSLIVLGATILALCFAPARRWWWLAGLLVTVAIPLAEWFSPGILEDMAGFLLFGVVMATDSVAAGFADTASYASRSQAWLYAFDLLHEPMVFLFGEGPVLRDANPGLPGAAWSESSAATTNFHSAFVNLSVTSGVPVALTVLSCLVVIALSYGVLSGRDPDLNAVVAYGAAWAWVGIIDGGMFGHVELMVLSIAPIAAISGGRYSPIARRSGASMLAVPS